MDATDRLVTIFHRLHPTVQIREPLLETLSVFLLGHPVHAHRRILADPMVRSFKRGNIDVMAQRKHLPVRILARCLHYPCQSR
jgi:hypothetical protein